MSKITPHEQLFNLIFKYDEDLANYFKGNYTPPSNVTAFEYMESLIEWWNRWLGSLEEQTLHYRWVVSHTNIDFSMWLNNFEVYLLKNDNFKGILIRVRAKLK